MTYVTVHVYPNRGYSADQVGGTTLGEIAEMFAAAIDEYGEDATLVTIDAGNYRGAKFGYIDVGEGVNDIEAGDDE